MPKLLVFLFVVLVVPADLFGNDLHFEKTEEGTFVRIRPVSDEKLVVSFADSNYTLSKGKAYLKIPVTKSGFYALRTETGTFPLTYLLIREENGVFVFKIIPGWATLLPPLIAIFLALVFKEVIFSLFIGVWSGVFLLKGLRLHDLPIAFFETLNTYIVQALANPNHAAVIIFSLLIGGLVKLVSLNGGMASVVSLITPLAKTRAGSQFATWIMGIVIFFDDYANTLLVGNTMRPITDKFKVSREKLAYLVDSTAAPIASVALITTWIGVELGYIADAIQGFGLDISPYAIFLSSLQYAFYAFFTLVFIFILIRSKRDFGPMLKAEKRAFSASEQREDSVQSQKPVETGLKTETHWLNALLPVLTLVLVALGTMLSTGYQSEVWQDASLSFFRKLSLTMGDADPYKGLLQGSLAGITVVIICTVLVRKKVQTDIFGIVENMTDGFKSMMHAIIILVLAWSLSGVASELNTAYYLSSFIEENFSPRWLPVIVFVLSAVIAFSTGSSWSTMAILFPLALPAAWAAIGGVGPENPNWDVIPAVTAVILGGAVLGDHCSPISDTTVLSSMASDCNHIDHVNTQLPYALLTGFVSCLAIGPLFVLKVPFWITFIVGVLLLWLAVRFLGEKYVG